MATLTPSGLAKNVRQDIPKDLGGYQQIVRGPVKDGDLLVWNEGTAQLAEFFDPSIHCAYVVDEHTEHVAGLTNSRVRVYRKLPVVNQATACMSALPEEKQGQGQAHGPVSMPTSAAARKNLPLATGVIDYFPDALLAVAACSKAGNDQHSPGQPLHWDRSKSTDESDALMRHFVARGTVDTDGIRHSAKVAWRALALLQKELEAAATSTAGDITR